MTTPDQFQQLLDEIWQIIDLRNDLQHFPQGFFVLHVPTFNESAICEAVLNAVSHRKMGSIPLTGRHRRYCDIPMPMAHKLAQTKTQRLAWSVEKPPLMNCAGLRLAANGGAKPVQSLRSEGSGREKLTGKSGLMR